MSVAEYGCVVISVSDTVVSFAEATVSDVVAAVFSAVVGSSKGGVYFFDSCPYSTIAPTNSTTRKAASIANAVFFIILSSLDYENTDISLSISPHAIRIPTSIRKLPQTMFITR